MYVCIVYENEFVILYVACFKMVLNDFVNLFVCDLSVQLIELDDFLLVLFVLECKGLNVFGVWV